MGEGGEVVAGDEVDVALEALVDDAALKVDGEERSSSPAMTWMSTSGQCSKRQGEVKTTSASSRWWMAPAATSSGGTARSRMCGYTLSWSRGRSFAADDDQRQTTSLRRLHGSFTELGGVRHERVTDTMSGGVDGWDCNQPILNIRFVDVAAYYRFAVDVSPRWCPRCNGRAGGHAPLGRDHVDRDAVRQGARLRASASSCRRRPS